MFAFHELCGSSTVARIVPGADDPLRTDPHAMLGSHHEWPHAAARRGVALGRIDTVGAYLVGTGTNHSERDSPVAGWRRKITEEVRRRGERMTASLARRFGQERDVVDIAQARRDDRPTTLPLYNDRAS